jgi:hypothetical protein
LFQQQSGRAWFSRNKPFYTCSNGFERRRHNSAAEHRRTDGKQPVAIGDPAFLAAGSISDSGVGLAPQIGAYGDASKDCGNDSGELGKNGVVAQMNNER